LTEKEQSGKRSLALPITLLLLVMSVMGNVLLSTKNIGYTRDQTVDEGRAVFTQLEKGKSDLAYWSRLAGEAVASPAAENGIGRVTAAYLSESIARGEAHLGSLLDTAEKLDVSAFEGAAGAYADFMADRKEKLAAIGAGSGPLADAERAALEGSKTSFEEMEELLTEFHYAGSDNKNVLIRLAGGHDWLPIAAKLRDAVVK